MTFVTWPDAADFSNGLPSRARLAACSLEQAASLFLECDGHQLSSTGDRVNHTHSSNLAEQLRPAADPELQPVLS